MNELVKEWCNEMMVVRKKGTMTFKTFKVTDWYPYTQQIHTCVPFH